LIKHRISICLIYLLLLSWCSFVQAQNDFRSKSVKVFKRNTKYVEDKPIKGVFQPTIASTRDGTIHLFAQGRLYNSHDNTEKVLLYKSSEDHGDSWSDTKYLTPPGSFWGIASYVVVDSVTDSEHINVIFVYSKVKLFELYSKQELTTLFNISKEDYSEVQTSILYRLSSSDNGETWERGILKEDFISKYDQHGRYISFFTPVGQINQVRHGPHKGRILAGGAVKFADKPIPDPRDIYDYKLTSSSFIYSDDNGESWQLGGIAPYGGNEASVAEIHGDSLIMIRRRNKENIEPRRILNRSNDGGTSWEKNELIEDLPSPRCLGILYEDEGVYLYSTPAKKQRLKAWLGYSLNKGDTWQHKVLKRGFFSYSDIERIKGTDYYIVAFARVHHGELGLSTKRFHKSWLFGNKL
jgi:sialidase-1